MLAFFRNGRRKLSNQHSTANSAQVGLAGEYVGHYSSTLDLICIHVHMFLLLFDS